MAEYRADARIPFRPLSYEYKDLAEPKELVVDYENHNVYISNINGELVDITAGITEAISKNPNIITDVKITLPSGEEITINEALVKSITEMISLEGGTMTGPLILGRDPQDPMEAVTKQYVDNADQSVIDTIAQILLTGEW